MSQPLNDTAPSYDTVARPDHVPEAHVVDFDYLDPEMPDGDVYAALKRLHEGPDIQWTPRNGGHWVVSRADDVRWVQENYQVFSHEEFFIPRGAGRVVMPPLTVDPPLHARYRAVYNPYFSASRVAQMAVRARELTKELIEGFLPKGRCEFLSEFAHVMPVAMFLSIVDLPLEKREDFIEWGTGFVGAVDQAGRDHSMKAVVGYLGQVLEERTANPGEDLLSRIAAWRTNPRFQGDDELIGMAVLIFLGGIDTVASLLSFTAWHLAEHPEHRRRIREEPGIVPRAAEEYIRRFGLSNTGRLITEEVERKGVKMLPGEMILVPIGASSIDDREYADPFAVDFDRPQTSYHGEPGHNTFGNGPHKCVGRPLARAELRIFLEEWLRLIPDFRLDPERPPISRMRGVNGVESLHLLWDA